MANRRLWGPTPADATAETVFTCPTGFTACLESVTVQQPAGSLTTDVLVSIGADATGTRVIRIVVPAGAYGNCIPCNLVVNSGEVLQLSSSATDDVCVTTGNGRVF